MEIKALVMAGKLPLYKFGPLSANKMLATKSIEGAFVLLSEIAEILTQEEIRRNLEAEGMYAAASSLSSAGKPQENASMPEIANWKMKVQVEATAMFLRLYKAGANPTVSSTKEDLAKWCQSNGMLTNSGIFPTAEYLRSHVLCGKHWKKPDRP